MVQLSGILALSIGLPTSSVCNKLLRRKNYYFPETEKSVQGAVCSVAAQMAFLFLVCQLPLDHPGSGLAADNWTWICPIVAVSLFEAVCSQNQYLVIPPILCIMTLVA